MPRIVIRAIDLGVYVCFRDSIDSGNCAAGTKTWIDQQGPIEVVQRFTANKSLVDRACEAAIQRAVREMNQGFCEVK